ncbi:MAG: hypothetical protein CVU38_00230 [Chloroflexi bacterium HGW-Chloroflexi-1]|nr:MAG: hypothetical protein CVU38_00230 [Chloroflexi bacterium HGW-Chloroflexi-1]
MTAGAIFNLVGQPQGRIATHSQYPIEPRARRMAEALASHGYDVDLFCLRHTGEAAQETLNGVTIHRLPVTRHQGKGSLAYIWEYLRFFLAAGWQITLRHLRKHYALIQVHNPPDFLTFGTLIPRMFGRTRVVLDVRDMAPELFQSRFDLSPDHLVTRTLRAHERWASAYADAVTVCTEHQPGVMARRGIPPDHMTIGMNCPDEVIFDQPAPDTKSEGFSLTYHGSILERSGLDVLITATSRSKRSPA